LERRIKGFRVCSLFLLSSAGSVAADPQPTTTARQRQDLITPVK
jgi:hypothetical protein